MEWHFLQIATSKNSEVKDFILTCGIPLLKIIHMKAIYLNKYENTGLKLLAILFFILIQALKKCSYSCSREKRSGHLKYVFFSGKEVKGWLVIISSGSLSWHTIHVK
jgi:hypothetical protein